MLHVNCGKGTAEEDRKDTAVFLWTEREAERYQTLQIGPSACGATAIINVLRALSIEWDQGHVIDCVRTHLRQLSAPLPEYLVSRSVAGCDQQDLIDGAVMATDGKIFGRFFPLWPRRDIDLCNWLAEWLVAGAVPVVVMNLQMGPHFGEVADAWHHQMVFGVSHLPQLGVHLTNPLEKVPVDCLSNWLCSPSVLLIRREDVLLRHKGDADLSSNVFDQPRWKELCVREQLVALFNDRELVSCPCHSDRNGVCVVPDVGQSHHLLPHVTLQKPSERNQTCVQKASCKNCTCQQEDNVQFGLFTHIAIPAVYQSGVVLFAVKTDVQERLRQAADLPLVAEGLTTGNERD